MQSLSLRLRRLVRSSRKTVTAVAYDAGVSPQTIHNIIGGRVWPDVKTLFRLEAELDDWLWINGEVRGAVGSADPSKRYRRSGPVTVTSFIDEERDQFMMEVVAPSVPDSWRWSVFVLTDEGWTRDRDGTADSADSAERGAEQHIADRIAAEASEPDERSERPERDIRP